MIERGILAQPEHASDRAPSHEPAHCRARQDVAGRCSAIGQGTNSVLRHWFHALQLNHAAAGGKPCGAFHLNDPEIDRSRRFNRRRRCRQPLDSSASARHMYRPARNNLTHLGQCFRDQRRRLRHDSGRSAGAFRRTSRVFFGRTGSKQQDKGE